MKLRSALFLLCLILLFAACGKSEKSKDEKMVSKTTEAPLRLIDKGIYALVLDSLASFDQMLNLQVNQIDGIEYLSFFDSNTSSFYIHNYESGALTKQVKLYSEGPNSVSVFMSPDYYLHTLDSIFIDTNFYGYFLINGKGEVLSRVSKGPDFSSEGIKLKFDQSSYLSEKGIHGTIKGHYRKVSDHFPLLRGTLKFTESGPTADSLGSEKLFDHYEEILSFLEQGQQEKKLYVNIHRHMMQHNGDLYATTVISDTIRVFRDQKLIRSIYAGVPGYDVIDYQTYFKNNEIIQGKNQMSTPTILHRPPRYESAFLDPQGKYLYRVMSHGTKPGISPHNGKEIAIISGATLLVINIETEERSYYELPVEEIEIRSYRSSAHFVSNKGIHFRVKEQDNEDQAEFRVFGVQ
ncbi:MAG: DUF4221 family protein [Roseivirga sp.]|nr:DUF4221 family protein [Roseivirga sp.]